MVQTELRADVPKFELGHRIEMGKVLQAMGIREAFGPAADSSGLFQNSEGMAVNDVIHNVNIDVVEHGTEAVAATAVVVDFTGASHSARVSFRADSPFMFMIIPAQNPVEEPR